MGYGVTPTNVEFGYAFSIEEYQQRLKALFGQMREAGVDILLVTAAENIFYLSGYRSTSHEGYQALVVPLDGEPQFVLRKLHFTYVPAFSWIKGGVVVEDSDSSFTGATGDRHNATKECMESMGGASARIGFDDLGMSLPNSILEGLREAMPKATFVPAGGLVERLRMFKSPKEIEYMRRAGALTVMGMEAGIAAIAPGVTENEVAGLIYYEMVRHGSEYVSSQPYVVAGTRKPPRRGHFEGNMIKKGDCVWFEASASVYRYNGPILRSFSVGQPSPEFREVADVMLDVTDAILNAVKPGATSGEVAQAARQLIEKAGFGEYSLHRIGYSIGVGFPQGWGEGHIIDIKNGDPRELQPGMAFHLVPWILHPTIGCVGFSESFVVTEQGYDLLTESSRELRICG